MAIRRFESNGRYSNVVEHNGVLYLTGQLCTNPAGDVKQQTKEILEKIEVLLKKYGSDKHHLLSAQIYLKDINNSFKDMNSVWDAWVSQDNEPARLCVEAAMASPAFLVEISVTAAIIN
ncbi:MAG: RidA family protein [Oscillospiraceae bacterium]|nr:RidA family protein [Oscillospiraceae bacterium]